jgi:hypothetical protein
MGDRDRLVREATATIYPLVIAVRHDEDQVVIDLTDVNGSVVWPDYATAPDELLATLAAEQRYLVEEVGAGSVAGATYVDKARERLRRARE